MNVCMKRQIDRERQSIFEYKYECTVIEKKKKTK